MVKLCSKAACMMQQVKKPSFLAKVRGMCLLEKLEQPETIRLLRYRL